MQHTPIKLIVGLGNPGEQYTKTRHNAGFLFLNALCNQLGVSLTADKHSFGHSAKVLINDHQVRLLAPATFMNLSGKAVVAATAYYKITHQEMLVVHDDLDLEAGTARLKLGGGHGGNNGLRDIIQRCASNDFARLRLGIGHPGTGRDVAAYVLKKPNVAEQTKLDSAIADSLRLLNAIVAGDFASAMQELHSHN